MQAIAEHGSFTGAAKVLGTTQPAISQLVKRQEQRLGTPLVERFGRRIRLTEAGKLIASRAENVLQELNAISVGVHSLACLQSGQVRIAAFPSAAATFIPPALADLSRSHEEVSVSLIEQEPPEALAALEDGECDIAVVFDYDLSDTAADLGASLQITELLIESMEVVVAADHPLARNQVASMRDFANERWVAGCPRCRGFLQDLAGEAGFSPQVGFQTEETLTMVALVGHGLGVAVLPELMTVRAAPERVARIGLSPARSRRVRAVTTADAAKVPAVAATLKLLGQAAESFAADMRR